MSDTGERRKGMPPLTAMRLGFSVFWIAVFTYTLIDSRGFPGLSGVFPQGISIGGIMLATAAFLRDLVRWRRTGHAQINREGIAITAMLSEEDSDIADVLYALKRAGWYTLWLFFYFFLIWLVSVVAASGIFIAVFLMVETRADWKFLVAAPILVVIFLMLLSAGMNLQWPTSLFTLL